MNITQAPASTTADNQPSSNLYSFQYATENGVLHFFLELEDGEDEGPDKPGFQSSMSLHYAMANGMNVAGILDPKVVEKIEIDALKSCEKEAKEAADDALIDAYEDRMFGGRCAGAWGWLA